MGGLWADDLGRLGYMENGVTNAVNGRDYTYKQA